MKKFNLSFFLGCCIIGICIIISSLLISKSLPISTPFPADIAVTTSDDAAEFKDYLSEYEVAAFLSISSDDVSKLIESGEIDAYGTKIGDSYVFSKVALEGWMNDQISRGIQ